MTISNENSPQRNSTLSSICHAPHCGRGPSTKTLRDLVLYAALGAIVLMAYRASTSSQQAQHVIGRLEMQAASEPRTITVTGTAEMLVPPDEISVEIQYREFWRSPGQVKRYGIKKIEAKIVAAAEKAGVSTKDISIKSLEAWRSNWNYWYYWNNSANQLTQKSLTIQFSSPAQLTSMIETLRKSRSLRKEGIVSITLGASSSSKIQEYRKLVKERAMAAAKQKASYLLGAVHESPGRLLGITELGDPKAATTSRYGSYGYPYAGALGWGGWGGYSSHTSASGFGVANTTVALPPGAQAAPQSGSAKAEPGMKPIRLQYSVQATYQIED